MTFVDSFYSFNLDITNVDKGLYLKTRIKTPKHPYETLQHLLARVLAFTHCYEEGIAFSRGLFAPEEPTIWKRDVIGALQLWVQVGQIDGKKLERSLRQHRSTRHIIYLYEQEQAATLHQNVHRIRPEALEDLICHQIDTAFLGQLVPDLKSSSNWQVTFVDNLIYLTTGNLELQTKLEPVEFSLFRPQRTLQERRD